MKIRNENILKMMLVISVAILSCCIVNPANAIDVKLASVETTSLEALKAPQEKDSQIGKVEDIFRKCGSHYLTCSTKATSKQVKADCETKKDQCFLSELKAINMD